LLLIDVNSNSEDDKLNELRFDKQDVINIFSNQATIRLIGSPQVINIVGSRFNITKKGNARLELNALVPLMAEELQGEDVYASVAKL
jgi:hypothetical protein